jgi:glycosyltransferase involved in cell wall biosynthesis
MVAKKIILSSNTAWSVYNFRRGLISAFIDNGHEVIVLAPTDKYQKKIEELGCSFVNIKLSQRGLSLFSELVSLFHYFIILRRIQGDFYLGFTIKPNIYGGIISKLIGVNCIFNVTGLGKGFNKGKRLSEKFFFVLYKIAFSSSTVFFQNKHDRLFFEKYGLLSRTKVHLLPGSGVDLNYYKPSKVPILAPKIRSFVKFSFIGRLLVSKGVFTFVEAARSIRQAFPDVKFEIIGQICSTDRDCIARSQLEDWMEEGVVDYVGHSDDIRIQLENTDCVVLPSVYKEGTPRSLLEAGAMGVPIITTNMPGCEDTVEQGFNGFLCEPLSVFDLAKKIEQFLLLSPSERKIMGKNNRVFMKDNFDEALVIKAYFNALYLQTKEYS